MPGVGGSVLIRRILGSLARDVRARPLLRLLELGAMASSGGATIWPALRGAKAKFKGGGAGALADEGRRLLRACHVYVFENK